MLKEFIIAHGKNIHVNNKQSINQNISLFKDVKSVLNLGEMQQVLAGVLFTKMLIWFCDMLNF